MTSNKEDILENLEHHLGDVLPDELSGMDASHLASVQALVDQVLERERAGLDKFFESISDTLKYIPNFIVLAVTNRYIEPAVAARITAKLPIKNAVQIAKGLSTEYICQTAIYLDDEYASALLLKLPKKQASAIIDQLYELKPLRVLDIFYYADQRTKTLVPPPVSLLDSSSLALNEMRREVLDDLRRIFAY